MDLVAQLAQSTSPDFARFDYTILFSASGCGQDVANFIFEHCPMGALARFAGTCREARIGVQDYIRIWIYRILKTFIAPGLSFLCQSMFF